MKKYKYLNYIGAPEILDPTMYDLVDDEEFCKSDGRIPVLQATQYGIFPGDNYGKKNYRQLTGLENQWVGFIGRGYLSNCKYGPIVELFLDKYTLHQYRREAFQIDLSIWCERSLLYKCLNYIPAPVDLDPGSIILVDDKEFCKPNYRTPLLMVAEDGVFSALDYGGKKDYRHLVGLENQRVGFFCRGYSSKEDIVELFLDTSIVLKIRSGAISIDTSLWSKRD